MIDSSLQLNIYQKLGLDLIDLDPVTGNYKKALASNLSLN